MKSIILINIIYLCLTFETFISHGVYAFLLDGMYLSYFEGKIISSDKFDKRALFRIIPISNSRKDNLYNIEEINSNLKLSLSNQKELLFNNSYINSEIWSFITIEQNYFVIKNINNICYIKNKAYKYICENIPIKKANKLKIIKIYNEVKEFQIINNKHLIDNEPIDILIKYIDLKDGKLKRDGIHQIEKDNDNEELRYSIRSIINYIPWIRKIYILMPNEKVRFFKEYSLIKDKIVYIKDKDFLGYDSSNSYAFQFRYWKMKQFGISDNIIVMDDDYFIGSKLEKNDFFYVEKGKVLPIIVTSNFEMINKNYVSRNCQEYSNRVKMSKLEQTGEIFEYSKYLTYSFLLEFFKIPVEENIYIPIFTHNAIPINLQELKEMYELIYDSKYKEKTLDYRYRDIGTLQFQIFVTIYTFIKYGRKVKNIPNNLIRIDRALTSDYNYPLFCINKGAFHYNDIINKKAKIVMEYLFPNPSPFEIENYNIHNLSFEVSKSLEKTRKKWKRKYYKLLTEKNKEFLSFHFIHLFFLFILFIKYNNRIYQKFKNYEE